MLRCNISQGVPLHPVVSIKSGHVFERALVERYIAEHGRCPITGAPLRPEDLVDLHSADNTTTTTVSSSGSLGAASVPTLLERLQSEWEGLALEQFALRQQVTQMEQELAHSLQQYEAACRVIAKLSKELATARGEKGGGGAAAEAEENGDGDLVVVPPTLLRAMDEVEAAERKSRKQRKAAAVANSSATGAVLNATKVAQWAVHASNASAVRVAVAADGASLYASQVVGDHAVVRYALESHTEAGRGLGHTAAVHTMTSSGDAALTASEDGTVRVWRSKGAELHCAQTLRYAGGVAAMSQRTIGGAYVLCGAPDGALYVSDVEHGAHIVTTTPLVRFSASAGLTCLELHPYSTLAMAALQPSDVQLWDTRAMAANTVIALPSSGAARRAFVASASFSADCVSMAAGLSDGSAYVWDLRQLTSPVAVLPANAPSIPATVRYSGDGQTLAVGGAGISLYPSLSGPAASSTPAVTAEAANAAVCGVCWTPEDAALVSGSVDGVVRVYTTTA